MGPSCVGRKPFSSTSRLAPAHSQAISASRTLLPEAECVSAAFLFSVCVYVELEHSGMRTCVGVDRAATVLRKTVEGMPPPLPSVQRSLAVQSGGPSAPSVSKAHS